MDEDARCIKAAEQEFVELFGPTFSHQFMYEFLNSFLKRYNFMKDKYSKPIRHDQSTFVFNTIRSNVEMLKKFTSRTSRAKATIVGSVLGSYLGVIEFGLTNLMFLIDGHKDPGWERKVQIEIVVLTGELIDHLIYIGHTKTLKFIKTRIELIRFEKQFDIAEDQEKLLTNIIFEFAKKRV